MTSGTPIGNIDWIWLLRRLNFELNMDIVRHCLRYNGNVLDWETTVRDAGLKTGDILVNRS
ncbi:hypothetical protein ACJQWK_00009 [Exserohilum turcicum]